MIQYHFSGKVVLITGSSRGMGAAILEAFARAGAVCILNYFADPGGDNQRDSEATAGKLRGLGATVQVLDKITASNRFNGGVFGLRHEVQTNLDDWRNFAPRGGILWSPFRDGRTTIRAGGGIFYDWYDAGTY